MICGIGCDIVEVGRMMKWISDEKMLKFVFNEREIVGAEKKYSPQRLCEHYAARFAAKEAFGKALGTGLLGFSATDVFIVKDENGAPSMCTREKASEILLRKFGENCRVHISLSHEKSSAIAFVVIER